MNRLTQQRADLTRLLDRWQEALDAWSSTGTDRDRDSAVLRFELAFELMWKHLQAMVREEGLDSAGPRQAFVNAHRMGWIENEVVWDEIIRARNTAVHIYHEKLAEALAQKLPQFQSAFVNILNRLPDTKASS